MNPDVESQFWADFHEAQRRLGPCKGYMAPETAKQLGVAPALVDRVMREGGSVTAPTKSAPWLWRDEGPGGYLLAFDFEQLPADPAQP